MRITGTSRYGPMSCVDLHAASVAAPSNTAIPNAARTDGMGHCVTSTVPARIPFSASSADPALCTCVNFESNRLIVLHCVIRNRAAGGFEAAILESRNHTLFAISRSFSKVIVCEEAVAFSHHWRECPLDRQGARVAQHGFVAHQLLIRFRSVEPHV